MINRPAQSESSWSASVEPSNAPAPAKSLRDALQDGSLPPPDTKRLRAQLSCADHRSPADARRALVLMVERVSMYFGVVGYTGPGYVFGRTDSEYPDALGKSFHYDPIQGNWYQRSMSVVHPSVGPAVVFDEAGAMCLHTALAVCAYELGGELPEVTELLRNCCHTLKSLVHQRAYSGVNWRDARRRIGARGIKRVLAHLGVALGSSRVGVSSSGVIHVAPEGQSTQHYRDTVAWSIPAHDHQRVEPHAVATLQASVGLKARVTTTSAA